MEIILVYIAVASLLTAIAGLFIPQRLVFWCKPVDRTRAMAFTAYLTLAIVLTVAFIVVVPEPAPTPPPVVEEDVRPAPPPQLTQTIFLKEVRHDLASAKNFSMKGVTFELLNFGRNGATAQLRFADKPRRKIAVNHATLVVQSMIDVFKRYHWKIGDSFLVECQVHTNLISPIDGKPSHRSMGFARYRPDSGKTTWLDYN